MKLGSFDELINFLKENDLRLSQLEFEISEPSDVKACPIVKESDTNCQKASFIFEGSVVSFHDCPTVAVVESDVNEIYVTSYESIPNACHMGKVEFSGRTLYAGICSQTTSEDSLNETSHIELAVKYEKDGVTQHIRRPFKLVKIAENQEEKILINIHEQNT